ncbi:proton-coupled zinc antiporter SLC30A2 [Lepeophtheirus salmonis]|uniref:Zinc transporter 2-like n=1 Tax=Lepeophtheirus salmonis TaxID=72036 RepID=A0A0K2TGL1_LEPSM|nr:zinc transporter 2-like [Lepeophtheirus salmonis]XP_040568139.1 zinc transporter 2-like [Lepeophtheirus salmonis]XP_040568140.1 zinc transporter 2-like [Lepeophtheirus salmonis]
MESPTPSTPKRSNHNSLSDCEGTSTPVVFCIHGNKYGIVKCCDDLIPEGDNNNFDDIKPLYDRTKPENIEHLCHLGGDTDGDESNTKARRKLILASVLCVIFMVVEIAGGVLSNSLALATDAAHLLTDFASFMISLFSLWVASRPATKKMNFGWHRAEVIGAIISVLMIWVVTGILVYMAINRVINQEFELDVKIMLLTSGIGVLFNLVMGCTLHQHSHSHGTSDPESGANDNQQVNINVKAAYIHVLGDFLQSIGVFIAAIVLYFKPTWILIDPICTFFFSILVLGTTVKILQDTITVLMEGIPKSIDFNVVQDIFISVEGIMAIHNIRIWGITTDKTALSAHLAIHPNANSQKVLIEATNKIRKRYDFYEMTLQIEEFHQNMEDCSQCQNPLE